MNVNDTSKNKIKKNQIKNITILYQVKNILYVVVI